MTDLVDVVRGGIRWCDQSVSRLVAYDEDGRILADITVPVPQVDQKSGQTDFAATEPGKKILEALANTTNPHGLTAVDLAGDKYAPKGWFAKVLAGLLRQGLIVQPTKGKYLLKK